MESFTNAVGIPTYGVEPVFVGRDLGNIHGLNEYVGVKSLLEGREFLYRLVKIYARTEIEYRRCPIAPPA